MKKDHYYWRLCATAISFITYGIGGVLLTCLSPFFHLLPISTRRKTLIARAIINRCFRLFIWQMQSMGIFTFEVIGKEKLKNGQLILANHPCFLDVVFIMSFVENANCIVKHGLFKNFFTRAPILAANYIPNREGPLLINASVESLALGDSLIIFPEGTRTPLTGSAQFQRGAANIALAAGITPLMIKISCTTPFLSKGFQWYDIPHSRPHLCFSINELDDNSQLSADPKSARQLTAIFKRYFFEE